MGRYFAALDAGCREVAAVAARWSGNGDCIVEGFSRVPSKGFRGKGIVTDAALATGSIAGVLDKLRQKTGKKIQQVYAGVSSASIGVTPSSGVLLLSKYGREISGRDMKRCARLASTIKMPLDREPLHTIVRGFSIDGEEGIRNPLNLEGVKMETGVNILTINSSVINNISGCIARAGFVPAGFVFSGLASACRVLPEEDRENGVALVDIGSDLTEVMAFHRGVLQGCRVFQSGTADISTDSGNVSGDSLRELASQMASLPGWKKIRRIVVTGEGLLMDDLIESLEKIFAIPVAPGTFIARPFEDLPPDRARYMGCLGVLDHIREEARKQRPEGNIARRVFGKLIAFVDSYF